MNAKTLVKIICREHGEFHQTPDKHLQSVYACPICNEESRSSRRKGKSLNNSTCAHKISRASGCIFLFLTLLQNIQLVLWWRWWIKFFFQKRVRVLKSVWAKEYSEPGKLISEIV